jgi:pSer/pThr/pTyr-binding forkhead associated (FHA) protein
MTPFKYGDSLRSQEKIPYLSRRIKRILFLKFNTKDINLSEHRTMQTSVRQTAYSPKLLHVQTKTYIDLPQYMSIIHIGKPNDCIPPDIDISTLPNSDVVSLVHANILVEDEHYSLEDLGSSNGTYLNHKILMPLTRYALKSGDRIDLGKGEKVTFLFQLKKITVSSNHKTQDDESVAIFTRLLGLALMLGGIVFLAGSITIGGILNAPLIIFCIAGILVLQYGGAIRHLGWVLIGVGVAIAIASGTIVLAPISLLGFLLAASAFSVGYQLFTVGKVFNYNLLDVQKIINK